MSWWASFSSEGRMATAPDKAMLAAKAEVNLVDDDNDK